MTSINAIRFDFHSGAMICDEQRGWNSEHLAINSADKIKPVVEPEIRLETGLAASYGNTGTSSIGDELKLTIRRKVTERFQELKQKRAGKLAHLMTIQELALLAFDVQTRMKRSHVDMYLKGKYGFTANDFVQGHYETEEGRKEIQQKEIQDEVMDALTWKSRSGDQTSVFLNSGIVAGYEPQEGFRIFALSIIHGQVEPVQEIFQADGSGRDMANVWFAEYTQRKTMPERRGAIDPLDGIWAAVDAVNAASRHNIGVDGYLNIILFDGRRPPAERTWEINDDRAKLASELVSAAENDLVPREEARKLVGGMIFEELTWEKAHRAMTRAAYDQARLDRFLRGYRIG